MVTRGSDVGIHYSGVRVLCCPDQNVLVRTRMRFERQYWPYARKRRSTFVSDNPNRASGCIILELG